MADSLPVVTNAAKADASRSPRRAQRFMGRVGIWLKGIAAAGISGAANGVVTGFAAIGIDPNHFNLAAGLGNTIEIGGLSAAISAVLGVALYLRQSPLPPGQ